MSPKPVSTIPDMDKTRELLLAELNDLRARNAALEQCEVRAKRLEADLRKNEEMTRQLLEQKLYGVWVNVGNKVAYINEVGASILGASNPGELVGKSLFELIHPDYQGIVRDRIKAMNHGDHAVPMIEEKYFRVDGQAVDVDVWAMRFIFNGEPAILVAFKDITERKRAEMALRESEAKYRDLVKNANSIIIRWDLKGNLTFINEFAEEFFGYPASEMLGKNVMDTIVPAAETTGKDLVAMISDIELHPERYKTNINENMRRNGERVWISWTNKAILNTQGKVIEILSVGNDITERKQAEEALKAAKAQAELYLDLMGHDINNMHQIALGYLELARDMHPEFGQREFLDKPIEVLQRSARLIRNVRKLQKLKEGVFKSHVVDLCQLLIDVQGEFGAVPHKAITLDLHGCEQCHVLANELLHDVFANLVGNAIKHTGERADIVVDLDIVCSEDIQYCRVIVEDDGPGIPDDFKGKVFNRLMKGTDKAKGMGLGLYLVKSLVESYGGNVRVEDRVPGDYTKGAKFMVMLPIVE
jgi:PAS domain S-box-containing protein